MKKKYILYGVATILLLFVVGTCIWYFTPKTFLKGVDKSEIASISVFTGGAGGNMTLENREEIDIIVTNIQSVKMKRGEFSSTYDGFEFRLTFKDKNGNVIESFIINSKSEIRNDPFFYECLNGELCFAFLQELENKY